VTVSTSFNAFDDPQVRKKAEIGFTLSHILVELCSEALASLTQLIPEFKALFRYEDLTPAHPKLDRRIELWTNIYLMK